MHFYSICECGYDDRQMGMMGMGMMCISGSDLLLTNDIQTGLIWIFILHERHC